MSSAGPQEKENLATEKPADNEDPSAGPSDQPKSRTKLPRAATFSVPKIKLPRGMTFQNKRKEGQSPAEKNDGRSKSNSRKQPKSMPASAWAKKSEAPPYPNSPSSTAGVDDSEESGPPSSRTLLSARELRELQTGTSSPKSGLTAHFVPQVAEPRKAPKGERPPKSLPKSMFMKNNEGGGEAKASPTSQPRSFKKLPRGMTNMFSSAATESSAKASEYSGPTIRAVVGLQGKRDAPLKTWEWMEDKVPTPQAKTGQLLIKVSAAGLRRQDLSDVLFFKGITETGGGVVPDRYTLGTDVAGIVHELGPDVHGWKAGDQVIAYTVPGGGGGCQEYVAVDEKHVFRKPNNLSMIESSSILTDGILALGALDAAEKYLPEGGGNVVVSGAATKEGMIIAQAVKARFGSSVTAICSDQNAATVLGLLDLDDIVNVVDDPTAAGEKLSGKFDVAFDAAGSVEGLVHMIKKGGILVSTDGIPPPETVNNPAEVRFPPGLSSQLKKLQERDAEILLGNGVTRDFVLPDYSAEKIKKLLSMVANEEIEAACGPTYGLQKCADAVRAARTTTTGKVIVCFM